MMKNEHGMSWVTRRQVLKAMGAGACLMAVGARGRTAAGAAPAGGGAGGAVAQAGGAKGALEFFRLEDVRLLDGPFLEAQKRDEAYLLKLEADRMLHNFRVNAGLEPKAPIYGGWESVQMWADIRAHGHTLGHYLTAASMMYASTGHEEMKKRVDYIVGELKECQVAGKTGLVCAFPDNTAQLDSLIARGRATGVPWYTLHKIFAGLRDAHLYCGSAVAREVLVGLADWAVGATKDMTEDQFQRMLGTEHGGMNEVLADVYTLTGKAEHLALAERFCHKTVFTPLSEGRDPLDNMHSNTQIPKIVGFARLHEVTGKAPYYAAAEFFWKTVTERRSFATGGNGDGERFFPVTDFARHVTSAKTMETCCSHNMLKLTRLLLAREPSGALADYYERALYNTILASQDPDTGMVTYFQSTKPGYIKLFCTPFDSFWCCTGTGIENHAKYGDSIYYRGAGGAAGGWADSLLVNLFIASTVNWKEKGVTVKQTTRFPEEGKTRLEITAEKPVEFSLRVRHPGWAKNAAVKVNGAAAKTSNAPGTFVEVRRAWKSGDVVEVDMPMTLHSELLPGTTDMTAILYGPIVLVGALGWEVKPGEDLHVNERTIGSVLNEPVDVPTFKGEAAKVAEKVKAAGAPLTFKAEGTGAKGPIEVTLVPYYKMAHQHYNMYWKVQA